MTILYFVINLKYIFYIPKPETMKRSIKQISNNIIIIIIIYINCIHLQSLYTLNTVLFLTLHGKIGIKL